MTGTVRRKLSATDLVVLQSLGYSVNGCFGSTLNYSDFCAQVTGGSKFVRYTSPTPNQTFLGVIESHLTPKISLYSLVENSLEIVSIEYLDHIGGPSTFTLSNDSIEVLNYRKGRNVLRFLLTNNQGNKLNAYAFLQLRGGGGENCEGDNCNLLSNSSFEILPFGETCGFIDGPVIDSLGLDNIGIACWNAYCNTPDLFFENCINQDFDFVSGPSTYDMGGDIPSIPDPNNNHIIQLYCRVYPPDFNGTPPPHEEAIQGVLAEPLIPGAQYEISMRIFRRDGGNPHLRIYFREGQATEIITNIADPQALELIEGPNLIVTAFQEEEWQTWTTSFTAPTGQTSLNTIVIANEAGPGANQRRRLFIDDVRIITTTNATFNIPQEFSCGALINSLQNFTTPVGGVVTGPGVLGTTNFTFSPVLAGPGTHTLTYTVTTANGCVLTAFDQVVVHPTINFNNAVVNPSCGQGCNGSITLNPNLNAPATVTYSWTGPSINSGNQNLINLTNLCAGTYTVTATINGVCTRTQSFTITSAPSPTASATTNIDLCSATGCNNSVLVTTNSPNNTISWVGNVSGFNPTNLCPGSYTATVTSPQGCSVQVPVTINFTAGPNLTVSNTQTVNMNVQDYNSITVQSGGYLSINTTGANTGTIGSMILVQNGGRLKISANLRFLPSAMIRVEQGGRVYIEGGSLSAHCPNTFWHGIEVLGTPNNTHDAVAQSITNFFTQDTDGNNGQGGLRIDKGAIIERAVIGVRLFTGNLNAFSQNATSSGGYIWANEMTFRNNTRDLVTSTLDAENKSRLSRVTFEVNSASLNTSSNIGPRVLLNHTRGIKFEGCTWSNTNVNLLNGNASNIFNMTGLSLFRSSCIVTEHITPTVKYPNAFNGFVYGIQNRGQCPDDMVVEFTEFRCYRGIYATLWADISTVRNCRFQNLNTAPSITIEIPPSFVNVNGIWSNFTQDGTLNPTDPTSPAVHSGPAYGLYLNACASTIVQYNTFFLSSTNDANMR
ncbi:MAG: hypothetical protein ACOVOV_11685, partial [Dolichospermum sp.]